MVERLGEGYRVLAVDFPGFGASAKPAGHRYSIHACTDAIEAAAACVSANAAIAAAMTTP